MMIKENLKISANKPLYGICWNHWRTYENRIAIRYASEAMIYGPMPEKTFYYSLARRSGIANANKFTAAMNKLDQSDTFCRDSLFNIGFCWGGYWLGKKGLSLYGRYSRDNLLRAIDYFSEVKADLNSSVSKTRDSIALKDLHFLENRINCTILHLKAFAVMKEINPLFDGNPDPVLSENEREKIRKTCTEALSLEKQYIDTHAQLVPDRGSEGTLVSYINGPYKCLKNIMSNYGKAEINNQNRDKPFDAPPEPGRPNM